MDTLTLENLEEHAKAINEERLPTSFATHVNCHECGFEAELDKPAFGDWPEDNCEECGGSTQYIAKVELTDTTLTDELGLQDWVRDRRRFDGKLELVVDLS